MSADFERIATETTYEGRIVTVRNDRFRYEDGGRPSARSSATPAPSACSPTTARSIWLVRQPREPIGVPDLLEVPAGKLDEEGESPLETAKRELEEEIGKAAEHWEHLRTYWSSPGFTDEQIHVYLATGLPTSSGRRSRRTSGWSS